MILSSIASVAATNNDVSKAHTYSMYSAVLSGISALLIGGALITYIYFTRNEFIAGIKGAAQGVRNKVGA